MSKQKQNDMPTELTWESNGLLYIRYSGLITGNEVLTSQQKLGEDLRFDNLKAIFFDGSEIKENLTTEDEIKLLGAITRAQSITNPNLKQALIVGYESDNQPLAEGYKALAQISGCKIEIFHTEKAAREWAEGNS
jgi:hypothetical protein